MFRELIPALADRYHVLAPDLPGFPQCAFGSKGVLPLLARLTFSIGLPNNSASWDVAGNPLRLVSCAAGRRHLINFLRWIFELRPQSACVLGGTKERWSAMIKSVVDQGKYRQAARTAKNATVARCSRA